MIRGLQFWAIWSLCFLNCACNPISTVDYYSIPTFTNGGINVVIEIPAGTNHKMEYQPESNTFENDVIAGQDRVIEFLPYPANYGFIPSTLMDKEKGGDGDALDVILIAESLPTGTVIEAIPIATLRLNDNGETDTKIVAIPTDPAQQLIKVENFVEFMVEYDAARLIIQEWFLSYKGLGATSLLGWEDDIYAINEIKKWQLKPKAAE